VRRAGSIRGVDEPGSPWTIERLAKRHDRETFACGEAPLDEFLRRFARQNDEKGISRTYVATRDGSPIVLGYYSIRGGAVAFDVVPEEDQRRLPRYPIPVVHLARLAVDLRARGQKLGETLLMHALDKTVSISVELGIHAVEVQAKNEAARAFYARYGFVGLLDDPRHMYLSTKAIAAAFGAGK
jgi:ribosomal protein S18 acetylase RimI-like enzyme